MPYNQAFGRGKEQAYFKDGFLHLHDTADGSHDVSAHALVYITAEKYGVKGLREEALQAMLCCYQSDERMADFCAALLTIFTRT
jgi:hypothetical protein